MSVSDAAIIKSLVAKVEMLQEQLRQLREDTVHVDGTFASFLSRQQAALLMGIYNRKTASYAYLDNLTEHNGQYSRHEGKLHITLRTKVAVLKLRRKLQPYGIEIKTWRGVGYYLDDENKAKLQALMEKKDGLL
jgi:hypothetical protein